MDALPLVGNDLHKSEMEYHGKFGHNLERIQHNDLMSRIHISYATCCLETQTMTPTIPGFQGINCCVQYMDSNSHKQIFYPSNSYDVSNFIRLRRIKYVLM